jgi:hypothetical protein
LDSFRLAAFALLYRQFTGQDIGHVGHRMSMPGQFGARRYGDF